MSVTFGSSPSIPTPDGLLLVGNVWHGTQEPWHNWDKLAGRFVSEFGMQAYPDIRTVDHWINGEKAERYPQSRTMGNHNKADGFERRLEVRIVIRLLATLLIETDYLCSRLAVPHGEL